MSGDQPEIRPDREQRLDAQADDLVWIDNGQRILSRKRRGEHWLHFLVSVIHSNLTVKLFIGGGERVASIAERPPMQLEPARANRKEYYTLVMIVPDLKD